MLTLKKLESLGVNTKEGLERCLNNETFYLNMVEKALSGNNLDSLEAALSAGDLDEAFAIVHNLKGMTGNLSLTPLYTPIAEMTAHLRKRENMDYTPFIEEIRQKWQTFTALSQD